MSEAGDEIRNAIARVRYKLPIEMREPVLFRRDISAEPDRQSRAFLDQADPRADLAPCRRRAGRSAARHRWRRGGQRRRRAAARTVGAAARAEAARIQRVGGRGGERAARAEHQCARGTHQGRPRREEHPAGGSHRTPERVQRHRRQAAGQRDRPAWAAGDGRRRLRGAGQLQPAQRPAQRRPVHHPLARGQHGHGSGARARRSRRRSTRRCPKEPSSRSPTMAARTRRTASTTSCMR